MTRFHIMIKIFFIITTFFVRGNFFAMITTSQSVLVPPDDSYFVTHFKETLTIKSKFQEPPDTLNYAHYRYLGTHNAHVYPPFFEAIKQQDHHLFLQLAQGVRGFMLDTYNWKLSWPNIRTGKGMVVLSHGEPGSALTFAQKLNTFYQTLKFELRRIVEWMKINPKAIITIILEDYADPLITAQEIKDVVREAGYDPVFKIADWPMARIDVPYDWPTLGWMRQHNKRLVIFTQKAATTDVTFNQFNYCIENQYSTTDVNKLWVQRGESALKDALPRKIVIFNNFDGNPVATYPCFSKEQMRYDKLRYLTAFCQLKGFAQGRLFNGYFGDFVIKNTNILTEERIKTAFDYVNELNFRQEHTQP